MKAIDSHRLYERIFKSPDGELLLEDMKRAHSFYRSTANNGVDALSMALAEGERNVILRILNILEHKEEDYVPRNGARG